MKHRIRSLRAKRGEGKIEPTVFKFRVYFENITEEELNRLRWSLTFDDPDCAHKIGRAKPLGFGSVRMSVKQVGIRQIDQETGEWSCRTQTLENSPIEITDAIKILKMMMNWDKWPKADVRYPNDTASHQWFKGNRDKATDARTMQPTFAKVLPKPEEEMATQEPLRKWLYKISINFFALS